MTLAKSVGFIKPVGHRYVVEDGIPVDEDALLIKEACKLTYETKDMSPLAITSNFTREFIDNPEEKLPLLKKKIVESFAIAVKDNDLVVIEGSGHAGVGSVFELSNARVAKLLDAKVVIVALGGIGKPVDEVAVNQSLFEKENVPIVGVVINKVIPEKLEQTRYYLSKSFSMLGLKLLGVIPYTPRLAWPTVQQVAESIKAEVINGEDRMSNPIADIIIGAMTANNALKFVGNRTLLIVPGDRDDVIFAAVTRDLLDNDVALSGIVLTGGMLPQSSTISLLQRTNIPILVSNDRTYDVASEIHDIRVKIRATDEEKTCLAESLIREHVDLETLWKSLS